MRVGTERFEVVGVFDKRPAAGGFNLGQDDFVVIPYTAYQRVFGLRGVSVGRGGTAGTISHVQIAVRAARRRRPRRTRSPTSSASCGSATGCGSTSRTISTSRTQDAVLKLWDRSARATFFALIVISSIALMVGGIGVMAIMSISVTERTREIGVRKALGARRAEILFQFLMEAAFLTSVGGLLGIVLGSAIGWAVHLVSGFPDLAALVVVRHRPRLLRVGRHLLRDVPGLQSLAPRPHRSAAVRIASRSHDSVSLRAFVVASAYGLAACHVRRI